MILLAQNACEFAFGVFHFMALVDDDVFPVVFVEFEPIFEDEVVGGYADVPLGGFHCFENIIAGLGAASVHYFADGWRPFVELGHPV